MQIFADLALNIRVSPAHVTQKHYLDEGGFGVIFAASVKLEVCVFHCVTVTPQ